MYLYLDAAYLKRLIAERVSTFLGECVNVDWQAVGKYFSAQRVYFYDGIEEPATRAAESDGRNGEKEHVHRIGLLDGYFLRMGSVRGEGRRKRQKEVDVLLAVDMLTHAHRQCTARMTLLSGDLDFKPVVEAVVDLGVHVTVACEEATGSVDLALAADRRHFLTLGSLWLMSDAKHLPNAEAIFPKPYSQKEHHSGPAVAYAPTDRGTLYLCESQDLWTLDVSGRAAPGEIDYWAAPDRALIERFATDEFGPLEWSAC